MENLKNEKGMLLAYRKNGPLFKPVFIIFICPFIYSQIICELHNFGPHFFLRYLLKLFSKFEFFKNILQTFIAVHSAVGTFS